MVFEYDEVKSRNNKLKHGVDFEEIQELWDDERYVQVPAQYAEESRFLVVGKFKGKIWSCVITCRETVVRIISARRSRRDEEELYERE
jgi:uncharacterized DUF497 family protein